MKLKSFIAKAAVITILAGVVHAPANFLYQDNQKAQWEITEQFNPVRRFKDIPDNQSAQGYLITGGVCFKNTDALVYPDYYQKTDCKARAKQFYQQIGPLVDDGILYGRIGLAALAVMALSLGSIIVSVSFVSLRKLWNIRKWKN